MGTIEQTAMATIAAAMKGIMTAAINKKPLAVEVCGMDQKLPGMDQDVVA